MEFAGSRVPSPIPGTREISTPPTMMCSKDASVCLGGSMRNLGFELERTMAQVNPQIGRHLKITRYRGAYADAIQRVRAASRNGRVPPRSYECVLHQA